MESLKLRSHNYFIAIFLKKEYISIVNQKKEKGTLIPSQGINIPLS